MSTLLSKLFLVATLFLSACNGGDDDAEVVKSVSISIDPVALSVDDLASSQSIAVTSNAEWGVSSNADWCKVSPSGGVEGTSVLKINIAKNEGESLREAILTFKSGSFTQTYSIKQAVKVVPVVFKDAAFQAYCLAHFDADADGVVSEIEVKNVTSLNLQSLGIVSLQGLEKFVSLQSFNCSNNAIAALDVSSLTRLTSIDCANNQLTELNLRSNINLNGCNCSGNASLTTILVWSGFEASSAFVKPANALWQQPEITTPLGYSLVWQDEFNQPRQSNGKLPLPDTSHWWYETGASGWGNNEIENYIPAVSGADTCAIIDGGTLKIVARKVASEVLSVRMNTTQSWTYGYFEARLKLPQGKGTWPAFWMLPKNFKSWPDDGEIDIMEEVGYRPNYVSSSIHCKAYYHSIGTQKTAEKYISTAESDFHVYAVEWTQDHVYGFVDGVCYFRFENDKLGNKDTWPFNQPFYLKLNLAWGGNWGGSQGVDDTKLPATYEIDYVRVFQKP